MRYVFLTAFALTLLLGGSAHAVLCTISGEGSKTCDIICQESQPGGPNPCDVPDTLEECDEDDDGFCTICGQTGTHDTDPNTPAQNRSNRIQGTPGPDFICGRNGDDEIFGNGGDDIIDGGGDDDEIEGNDGNDRLYGGSNDDIVDGGDGENVLDGGSGNDTVQVLAADNVVHDALGSILCGGSGDDTLIATGSDGPTCFDGGTDTAAGSDSCSFTSPGVDAQDVATKRLCETSSGTFETFVRSCGCP